MTAKKILSCTQSVETATLLFEINTKRDEIVTMTQHAGLPQDTDTAQRAYVEWLAFTHAAIVYSLMHRAPAAVVAAYLRSTTALLQYHAPVEVPNVQYFVDSIFSPYMECLAQERQKDCPALFVQRVCELPIQDAPATMVRVLSGVMAMALCSVLDAVSQYDMQVD